MINTDTVRARLDFIKHFYKEAFEQPGKIRSPEIDIRFYPYIGLQHTIRLRDGRAYVRLSELMADAPLTVQRALAFILVAKLMRRKVNKTAAEVNANYVSENRVRERAEQNRKLKGRKIVGSAQGRYYDLEEM